MRRLLLILCIVVSSCCLPLFTSPSDLRYVAMGEAGIALYDTPQSYTINPAALFFQEPALFSLNMAASESIVHRSLASNDLLWGMQNPKTLLEFVFSTKYSALSVGFGFDVTDREINSTLDGLLFNSYNDSNIQFNVSYGFRSFSFGMFAQGGTRMKRPGIEISEENPLLDYVTQVYLNQYYPSNEEQQFSTGVGLLVTYPYISLALLTNSFFVMDYDTNEVMIDANSLLEDSAVGIALFTSSYDDNNELNRVVLTSAFDIHNIADDSLRSIHMGLEVKIQFLKDLYVAVQGGYKETRAVPKPLFGIDGNGSASLGISTQIDNLFFNGAFVLPVSWLSSNDYTNPASIELSLHYNL